MQPYRITARAIPRTCRASCGPASSSRTLFAVPVFGSHQTLFNPLNEINSVFRLLDNAASEIAPTTSRLARHQQQSFTPRFDVREVGGNYELQGELPGIGQKDVEIEFVDERTLAIRGKFASEETKGNAEKDISEPAIESAAANKDHNATLEATDDAASERLATYQKASVAEEDEEYVDAGAETDNAATKGKEVERATPESEATVSAGTPSTSPDFKYWVNERSAGNFERRFAFPVRIDQDAVKASLRDGILSVIVPKLVGQSTRKIEIQ